MAQLRPEIGSIRKLGAELVIVGNGKPFFAAAFKEDMEIDCPLYCDTKLNTYKAAGLKRSMWLTIGPPAWGNAWRAFRSGFRQSSLKGDPWQEGGVFVITPDGKAPYRFVSNAAGDHPPNNEVLAALRSAVKAA